MRSFKRRSKKIGLIALSILILVGMSSPIQASPEGYQEVDLPTMDGKVSPDLLPKGAKMDEKVEVIIQFEGEPVLKKFTEAKKQGNKLGKQVQKNHAKDLKSSKEKAKALITKKNGKVIDSFEKVYNGLYVQVERRALKDLSSLPEVTAIHSVKPVELHNDTSVPFIGAPNVWEKTVDGSNVTGEGITVAIIDTGIDYTHASFGGEGTVEAYESNNPAVVEEGTFPTAKVVGGWDFVGTEYDASSDDPEKRIPKPDADPLDENGHGTHVAATVAGLEVEGKVGHGVAPDALLYAYKVFGEGGSTGVTAQALEMAMDPNGDGDVSDHVDVVNMSLGSPYGHPEDPSAQAANLAVEAGVIVVASAGNSGDVPYITGSPAVADKAISVAASVDDGIVVGALDINSPEDIAGQYEAVEGAITTPLAETGEITNDVVYVGRGCLIDEFLDDPEGKIAMMDRGECSFTEKLQRALDAGAVAGIVANNAAGDPIVMGGDDVNIPGVMIHQSTGNNIKDALNDGETVNISLSDDIQVAKPELADTIADFSSKGPGRGDIGFKPEISAPGYSISSADVGAGDGATQKSGTSMAAPHVAGVAALLKQLRPDWNAEEIKSLMMNTSTTIADLDGEIYPLSRQGAGRVQADIAADTTSVAYPQAISLGYMPVSDEITIQKNEKVTITNKGDATKTYTVSWEDRFGTQSGAVNVDLPNNLTVKPGKSAKLKVDFSIDANEVGNDGLQEFDGYIVLTEENGESLRVPYQAVVEKMNRVQASSNNKSIKLKNKGEIDAITDFFVYGDEDATETGSHFDVKAVGARSESGVTEFVVTSESSWETPNMIEYNIYIDNDMDGEEDHILFNIDLGTYSGVDPTGEQVSVLYDLETETMTPLYYITLGGSYNDNYMGLPVSNSIAGIDGEFQYRVESFNNLTSDFDMNDSGWIKYEPSVEFEELSVEVPAHSKVDVGYNLDSGKERVLVISNSESPYKILNLNNKSKGKK
ncbi:S8 family peptidase [Piscibacillus halophilus]|uniref:PA domain-containing protein n=1 Tax=Piscibacillus halophilus TaxID=571933 RepID=A0A1H9HIV3_9BACI|nr:S8 family serine peptidase [Piscibacillus halophilus]SEQ62263.1 PA domain-containing protein [Piscibacillus halophilus]